uniref:Ribosomal protein S14 n=1 Tax=Stachyamoeba lipophora TaxID=463046 RepID=A0A0B5GNS0_STALP|nr:ribosomal protein S14 [Stachyamoeba lipophora]AJF22934.1 ribosomal protein S14 [Stachyamoeba lipophora]
MLLNKDFRRRMLFLAYQKNLIINKAFLNDMLVPVESRFSVLKKKKKKLLSTKLKNRCVISGRTKSVYSYFKLTRMLFKNLATTSNLNGVKKYSW